MAIYTGGIRQHQEARASAARIAKQQAQAQAAESKRKGRSGLFGKIGGALLGAAAVGLTGGLAAPLVLGVASSLGKKWADEASKGASPFGKMLKTSGQVDKITAGGKYGYGQAEAASLTKGLEESRKTDFSAQTMLGDIGSSYLSAGMAGELGGAKSLLKGKSSFGEALTGSKDWGKNLMAGDIGGWEGMKSEVGSLIGFKDEGGNEIAQDFEPKGIDYSTDYGGQTDEILDIGQTGVDEFGNPFSMAQGGQVMDQNTLIGLAILAEMGNQKKTYDDTPLEEIGQPTIAEMFESQGKTLGGNNTKSIAQMMGK